MDECQNVIAFNDLEVTDDATITTETNTTDCMNMGQSESKKLAKRAAASAGTAQPETKGTAMSFGFKKKLLHTTAGGATATLGKKERQRLAAEAEANGCCPTAADNTGDDVAATGTAVTADDNGNTPATAGIRDNGRTTPRLTPPRKESTGGPYRSIRFGFRQSNAVRPASTGPSSAALESAANVDSVSNNNVTVKPRSKSASNNSTRSITPNGPRHGANQSFASPSTMTTPPPSSSSSATSSDKSSSPSLAALGPPVASSSSAPSSASVGQHARTAAMHPKISGPVSTTVNISYQQQQQQQQQQQSHAHHSRPIKPAAVAALEMSQHVATAGHKASLVDGGSGSSSKPPSGKLQTTQQPPQHAHPHQHLYTNDIIRPTPQPHASTPSSPSVAALVSKFTLHTSSLPQPQFPVAINLASATPSPVDPMPPTHYPSHSHPSAYTSPTVAAAMDTKYAKQTANATRRYGAGGFRGPRDISADSGIANMGSGSNNYYGGTSSAEHSSSFDSPPSANGSIGGGRRTNGGRPRNLEMVLSTTRHKFDVRELDDSLSDESPLAVLPKLPSSFGSGAAGGQQQAPLSGLTRQPVPATANYRKASFASLMDVPSIEEEKEFRDKTTSEKGARGGSAVSMAAAAAAAATMEYSPSSKNSSPISSRASWCNAGESMAQKDCSSMSVSSCESMNNRDGAMAVAAMSLDEADDVDNCSSALVISGDMLSSSISFAAKSSNISDLLPTPRTTAAANTDAAAVPPKTEQALTVDIGHTFAEITASVDEMFLDDETSPTDSLVSSTDSDEIISKRNKKKINDAIKGLVVDFEDGAAAQRDSGSPLLMSPCSPTHASHSLSLSDEGRDFLIDDEIADQPALCFSKSHEIAASMQQLHSLTDTPTLIETATNSHQSAGRSRCTPKSAHDDGAQQHTTPVASNANSYAPQAKPRQSLLSRTESLDTMSSCESIASDDMMVDFESSIDSIDRMCQSVHSGSTSALHSMGEQQLWSEWENQGGGMMHEWSTLMRGPKPSGGRDSVMSQLPARATRLLNRSRVQHGGNAALSATSHHGSDSPRSLDSFSRRTPPRTASHHRHHQQHHLLDGGATTDASRESVHSSDDSGLFVLDKLTRNTLLQDVLSFKKQLLQLRSVLQEPDEECLTRTDTLNPFEISNGQFFGNGATGADSSDTDGPLNCSGDSTHSPYGTVLTNDRELYQLSAVAQAQEESRLELADLRRQVVYLQDELNEEVKSQMDDKDRTIRYQQTLIEKLETEIDRNNGGAITPVIEQVDTTNTATQTERVRPIASGQDVSASTSESEEPATTRPTKPMRQHKTPPMLAKRQQPISRLTSPLLTTSSSASSAGRPDSNGTIIATSAADHHHNMSDFQHSIPKISPNASPRRIPRLLKSTMQSTTTTTTTSMTTTTATPPSSATHSLSTANNRTNGREAAQPHHHQPKSNGSPLAAARTSLVERQRCDTLNHINQAQHNNYSQKSTQHIDYQHQPHSTSIHRTHNNNQHHVIINHANNGVVAENAAANAKHNKLHNKGADMMRSPVFRTPAVHSVENEI